MSLIWDDVKNLSYNSFTGEYSDNRISEEEHIIPSSAPYIVQLYHSPVRNVPSTVTAKIKETGQTLIERSKTTIPSVNQFNINYDELSNGQVRVHSSNAGKTLQISYDMIGTIINKESLESLIFTGDREWNGEQTFNSDMNINGDINGNQEINGNLIINGTLNAQDNVTFVKGFKGNSAIPITSISDINNIYFYVVSIPSWNMDTDATNIINIRSGPLGTDYTEANKRIFNISGKVWDDSFANNYFFGQGNNTDYNDIIVSKTYLDSDIASSFIRAELKRRSGSIFDSSDFNDAGIVRGYLIVWYIKG